MKHFMCTHTFSSEDAWARSSNPDTVLTDRQFFELLNKDINSGDFRKIDLFSEPFNVVKDYELIIDDFCDGKEKYFGEIVTKSYGSSLKICKRKVSLSISP